MELNKAILLRRSKRRFLDKKVKHETLMDILEVARYAPSSGNLQNWSFVIVQDKRTKQALAKSCLKQTWLTQAPVLIVVVGDIQRAKTMYPSKGELYTTQNCANASTLIMLKATELKLTTCWVGAFDENSLSNILDIPPGKKPLAVIALGHSNQTASKKKMLNLENITFFEKYKNKEMPKKSIFPLKKKK